MKNYSDQDLFKYHQFCFGNKESINKSKLCGCFHCCLIYRPSKIVYWTMEQAISKETAWCPYCEIDSVIGDFDHSITIDFLHRMNEKWFSGSQNISPEILAMFTTSSQLLCTQHRS